MLQEPRCWFDSGDACNFFIILKHKSLSSTQTDTHFQHLTLLMYSHNPPVILKHFQLHTHTHFYTHVHMHPRTYLPCAYSYTRSHCSLSHTHTLSHTQTSFVDHCSKKEHAKGVNDRQPMWKKMNFIKNDKNPNSQEAAFLLSRFHCIIFFSPFLEFNIGETDQRSKQTSK